MWLQYLIIISSGMVDQLLPALELQRVLRGKELQRGRECHMFMEIEVNMFEDFFSNFNFYCFDKAHEKKLNFF